ncbi:MAG: hypothetical protein ACO1SX_11005 [Actinomycetota bacterium]
MLQKFSVPLMLGLLVLAAFANLWPDKAGLVGWLFNLGREHSWAATLAVFAAIVALAGFSVHGRWDGVFIDERNRISLSRFQLVIWTTLLVSALFTAGLTNALTERNADGALAIWIPPQIWALLGLSSLSAYAAPRILSQRATLNKDVQYLQEPKDARWIQIILTDDKAKPPFYLDVNKVQQLAFTVLLAVVYGGDLWTYMLGIKPIAKFPPVDSGFLALLTISHTAYLAGKVKTLRLEDDRRPLPNTKSGVM